MTRPVKNLRMFVAVYPPPEVARHLLDTLVDLDLPDHRLVRVEQVHLTMHFIGDVPVKDLEDVVESVARSAAGLKPCALAVDHLISLPKRGRARLVAARADAPPPILELQRRLVRRLAKHPHKRPDDRFLPHLTLCRYRAPSSRGGVDQSIEPVTFRVERVHLMRSTLRPDGAEHHVVAETVL